VTTLPEHESRVIVEPPLVLDRGGGAPLAAQITGQLRTAVLSRRLRAGERLPSSRALAASLGVSRTVVTNAYTQLFAEGWLEGRHGSGTYVAEGAAGGTLPGPPRQAARPARTMPPPEPSPGPPPAPVGAGQDAPGGGPPPVELRPGVPWVPGIDRAAWRRAWRQAAAAVPARWPDPRGLLPLRTALCAHLRRTRGLDCTPDHMIITRGVGSGLGLLASALLRPGDRAGIEDPGYAVARSILAAWGAGVTPCPVDSHGLVTGALPDGLRLMYVTPAHQYPLGGRLPVPRRQALAAWARAGGALIVEDDYDSEFRYDVAPLPALYGLDPDVVAYLGTTAKTLTPTFGVGWLVARPDLVSALAGTRESQGDRTSESAQRAMLAMIESGDLDRHIRRMRRVYARRRDAIVSILGDPAVPGTLRGDTAGLHVVLELPGGRVDEVLAAARRRGLVLHTLGRYFAGPPAVAGLVLGYGGVPERQVAAAATLLRDVLLDISGR
jgi:GntR family transcriptional regulator/MocR family aminotransferase